MHVKRNIISSAQHFSEFVKVEFQDQVTSHNKHLYLETNKDKEKPNQILERLEPITVRKSIRSKNRMSYRVVQEYVCDICKSTFQRRSELNSHKKVHSDELDIDITARNQNHEHLIEIVDVNEEIKKEAPISEIEGNYEETANSVPYTGTTELPVMKKKRKSRLTESQRADVAKAKLVIGDRTVFHCDQCNKNILHQFSYLTHLRIHSGEKPFFCHICSRQFRTASQLVRHINDVHEGIKNHPCDLCGRKFAHARARNEHRRTHTQERPCVCEKCGKAFKTKASLYVHNTFHLDIFKHQCPHCPRQFRRRQEMNDHIMIHTGEKPFQCATGTCTKSFRQRQELKRHLLTHSTLKPFECPVCKQCFSQKRYLRNHSKTHDGQ